MKITHGMLLRIKTKEQAEIAGADFTA